MSKSGFARVFERFLSRIEAALSQAYTIPAVKNAWRIPGYRPFNLDRIFSGHMWAGKMFPHADAFKRICFWIILSSDSGKTQIAEETKANWREDLFLRKSTMSKSMSRCRCRCWWLDPMWILRFCGLWNSEVCENGSKPRKVKSKSFKMTKKINYHLVKRTNQVRQNNALSRQLPKSKYYFLYQIIPNEIELEKQQQFYLLI